MLDSFQIFTKGGLILFQWSLMDAPKGSPVDELVKQCLLEERAGETERARDAYDVVSWLWISKISFFSLKRMCGFSNAELFSEDVARLHGNASPSGRSIEPLPQ